MRPLLRAAGPTLGGCAVQAALTAAELAPHIRGSQGASNAHLRPAAIETCTAQAARYGAVFVVDVEQRRRDRIIVWGSVADAQQQRRTFECHYTTKLAGFRLGEPLAQN
jgi:hypothetical protein